jgi:cell division protein FtsI (penicillin-binding protein 3)
VIKLTAKKMDKGLVPNVKGLGARDAVALLEKEGLRVIISGAGRVISQSQSAGSPLRKGSTIVLKLG